MASLAIGVLQRQSGDGEPDVRFTPLDDGSALIGAEAAVSAYWIKLGLITDNK
ncbi:hypothetical protein [Vreelandella sp. H-I2]